MLLEMVLEDIRKYKIVPLLNSLFIRFDDSLQLRVTYLATEIIKEIFAEFLASIVVSESVSIIVMLDDELILFI
jgi:hypothetical protein